MIVLHKKILQLLTVVWQRKERGWRWLISLHINIFHTVSSKHLVANFNMECELPSVCLKNKLKQYQLFLRRILSNILSQYAIYCKINSFQLNVNQMKHILDNAQMVNNTISLGKHVSTDPLDRDSGPSTSQLVGGVAAVDGGILFASQHFLKVSEGFD